MNILIIIKHFNLDSEFELFILAPYQIKRIRFQIQIISILESGFEICPIKWPIIKIIETVMQVGRGHPTRTMIQKELKAKRCGIAKRNKMHVRFRFKHHVIYNSQISFITAEIRQCLYNNVTVCKYATERLKFYQTHLYATVNRLMSQ